jgi:hypothetical protein
VRAKSNPAPSNSALGLSDSEIDQEIERFLEEMRYPTKKASPKKASPKKASPKKASPKKASPKKASPKKAAVR